MLLLVLQQLSDHVFHAGAVAGLEAFVGVDQVAFAVDQVGTGHDLEAVEFGDVAFRVVGDFEVGRYDFEELLRVGLVLVEVDRDDLQAFIAVALLHLVHPWKGVLAGHAPGGPEIHEDHLVAVLLE